MTTPRPKAAFRFYHRILLLLWGSVATYGAEGKTPLPATLIQARQQVRNVLKQRRYDRASLPLYHRAMQLAAAAHVDSLRGLAAYGAGRTYYNLSRLDSAQTYLQLARRCSRQAGDLETLVRASDQQITLYNARAQPDSATIVVRQMRALYPHTRPMTAARARLDVLIGTDYMNRSQYAPALKHWLLNQAYQRQVQDTSAYAIALINTGELFYVQENYPQAIVYNRQAIRWAKLTPSLTSLLEELYTHLAKTYVAMGQLDSARTAYETGLRLLGPNPENLGEASFLHANLADLLARQHLFGPSRQHAQTALRQLTKVPDLGIQTRVFYFVGTAALLQNRYAEARANLRRSYAIARQLQIVDNYQTILRQLAEAEARTGHPAEAYRLAATFIALRDSSVAKEGQQALAAMEARYQNQDKQRQIALLHSDNRRRRAELTAQRRTTYLALAGAAALLLIIGLIGYLLRQRQRTATLLARQNAQLAEANQTKAQLFSIISHDLRAPVSSLFQLLEITLEAPELSTESQRQTQQRRLRQMARDLLGTMDELLLWSKNQLDRLDPVRETVDVVALLAELEALYAPLAQQRGVALAVQHPPALAYRTDANFLRVVLRNLIQNALKYCPTGGHVAVEATATAAGMLQLQVRDTGPGLPAAQLAALLDPAAPWPQSGPARGLGLRLSREFVTKLGGQLGVRSAPGQGTTFTVKV